MSLLGFDAIGRWALGQNPSSGSVVLATSKGTFAFAGNAALFSALFSTLGATTYAFAGNAATFTPKLNAISASYVETGEPATFSLLFPTPGTNYAETGNAATFKISISGVGAACFVNGFPANVVILEGEGPGTYTAAGNAAKLARDFVNWLPTAVPGSPWMKEAVPSSAPVYLPFSGAWDGLVSARLALGQTEQRILLSAGPWAAANSQGSSWNSKEVPASAWSRVAPPSNVWKVDPAQQILPPVTE
jgi:hypothetical protein